MTKHEISNRLPAKATRLEASDKHTTDFFRSRSAGLAKRRHIGLITQLVHMYKLININGTH